MDFLPRSAASKRVKLESLFFSKKKEELAEILRF